jgi:predicted RNA-binding Zn ribbon-like protein
MGQERLSHYMNTRPDPFTERGFGDSAAWLDFVNSELWDGYGNCTEMLDDPAWVKSFIHYWGYRIPLDDRLPQKEFRRLRALLRQLVEKAAKGKNLRMEELAPLNDWMKIPVIPQLEEYQNGLQMSLRIARSGWDTTLANLAASFAQTLVEKQQRRLKICQNQECRWIFVDGTKGHVRRWCNDATCGNRERVRRARAAKERKKGKG